MINIYSDDTFIDVLGCGKRYYETAPDELFYFPTSWHDLREYYQRRLGSAWYVYNKQSAVELLTVNDYLLPGVIIQHRDRFYVFVTNFLSDFTGLAAVNEIIIKQRLRYPTIDIDSKIPSLADILSYFNELVDSINDVLVFETTGGYHVLLKTIPIDFEEHRSLLKKVASDRPSWSVDTQAGLYSIKLPTTRSAKPTCWPWSTPGRRSRCRT